MIDKPKKFLKKKMHLPNSFAIQTCVSAYSTSKVERDSSTENTQPRVKPRALESRFTLYKMKKFITKEKCNSNLVFYWRGSSKWTPRKVGILPTEVGNPAKVTCEPVTTHFHTVSEANGK